VIGDRTIPESVYAHDIPVMRKLGSRILSFFAGNYFTPGYYDTQCGIKGFRASVAERIFSVATVNGFSFDMEILFIALKRKHVIARVPVEAKKQATSNVKIWVHGIGMLADLVRIARNSARGKYRS
jgi:dolichyl-phosphate beta-glucosyltransferase